MAVYKRLKMDAARETTNMSAIVESALAKRLSNPPIRTIEVSTVSEAPLVGPAAALQAHGAPLLGHSESTATLEETLALSVEASRQHPALLRSLMVVLAKNRNVQWEIVRRKVSSHELPAFGAIIELAAVVTTNADFHAYAVKLAAELQLPVTPPKPFFMGALGARAMVGQDQTPDALRQWGFVCATPLDDFQDTVKRFVRS